MGINEAVKTLKQASEIALFCHINPDCDTICSALALYFALNKIGKNVFVFCDGEFTGSVSKVNGLEVINCTQAKPSYELSVSVDCGDENRVGKYSGVFSRSKNTLCIDHHRQVQNFAKINYVDSTAAATAQMMFGVINALGDNLIDDEIATLLYTGLCTDTGNFSFSNTTKNTLAVASSLLNYNVKNADISYCYYKEIALNTFKLKARVINKAEFFENNQIGVLHFTKEDFDATDTLSGASSNIVNEVINIDSVRIAVSVTDVKPRCFKISVRTQDDVDASRIALHFGGGGHKNAAGFVLNGYYENVLDDILKVCRDNL